MHWREMGGVAQGIAPSLTRVAVLLDAGITAGVGQFAVIRSVAPSIGVDVRAINMRDAREMEQDITRLASSPNGGLILRVVHFGVFARVAHEVGRLMIGSMYDRRPPDR